MCEIEYEEFDNKDIIYRELNKMIFDNENENKQIKVDEYVKKEISNNFGKEKYEENFEKLEKIKNVNEFDLVNENIVTESTKNEIKSMFKDESEIKITNIDFNNEIKEECNQIKGFESDNINKIECIENENTNKIYSIDETCNQGLIKLDENNINHDKKESVDVLTASVEIENNDNNSIKYSKIGIKTNNKIPIKEDLPPKRLSELYSQFNINWKDKLKSKSLLNQNHCSSSNNYNNDEKNSDIDLSDKSIIPRNAKVISKPAVCVESSCYDDGDEIVNCPSQIKEKTISGNNVELSHDSSNNYVSNKNNSVDSNCASSSDKIIALLSKEDIFRKKPVCVISSCYSVSDEMMFKKSSKPSTTSGIGCGNDSDEIVNSFTQIREDTISSKNLCSSSDASDGKKPIYFDSKQGISRSDSDNMTLVNIPKKPISVESGCFSASDEIIFKKPSKVITSSGFGCGNDSENTNTFRITRKHICVDSSSNKTNDDFLVSKTNTTSCETETNTDNNIKNESTFSTQIDETYNSLEEKIIPFIKSAHSVELRLKGRLSVFQRACVKQIATEHKLLIKQFGKGKDSYILLRKKIELLNAQKLFLEMKRTDIQKKKEKAAEIKAKQERLLNPPLKVSSGCQVDLSEEKEEPLQMSKNTARKNRKKQWEQHQKQLAKRNSETQTLANGFYLCPYCEGDIPESHQATHYPYCLSKYRSQQQYAAKSGQNYKDTKLVNIKSARPMSSDRKQRSKSRDKIHHSTLDKIKKELDKIHNNDINSMVNVLNELNKQCAVSGCNKKKQKTCDECMAGYCSSHYSPDISASTKHFNCPVALEKAESERSKKLGINNPLLKTIEELSTPRFADGALLKKSKRVVRVVEASPQPESTTINSSAVVQSILPPNINETRLRNGAILSFERHELRKKLREKIGSFTDRRTK